MREDTFFLKKKVINAICANRNGNPKLSRRGIVKDILVVSSLENNQKIFLLVCLTVIEMQSQILPFKGGARGKNVAERFFHT